MTEQQSVKSYAVTNAASSGIAIDRQVLKTLVKRSDAPGLIWLLQWSFLLFATGGILYFALGSWWVVPAMLLYGAVLVVPAYAISHETAHGTAFRTKWLNETALFISSFIYFEEAYHRRYAHTSHHTHTYHIGLDAQIPYALPMTFKEWLLEMSNVGYYGYYGKLFIRHALGRFTPEVLAYTPENELNRLKWSARGFLAGYGLLGLMIAMGYFWPLWFLVLPRLVGGPMMVVFTILQHAELAENAPSIVDSTRTFESPGWLMRLLYLNMNNHVEHHLYPQIPFYSLPALREALKAQLPKPDQGLWRCNAALLSVVMRRSLGRSTQSEHLRQAPHMITTGHYQPISQANMR